MAESASGLREFRERLAAAWSVLIDGLDPYRVGQPALDLEGKPMRRCTLCGVPRGTLRHALRCVANDGCSDPDARFAGRPAPEVWR